MDRSYCSHLLFVSWIKTYCNMGKCSWTGCLCWISGRWSILIFYLIFCTRNAFYIGLIQYFWQWYPQIKSSVQLRYAHAPESDRVSGQQENNIYFLSMVPATGPRGRQTRSTSSNLWTRCSVLDRLVWCVRGRKCRYIGSLWP